MEIADQFRIVKRLGTQTKRTFSDVFLVEDKLTGKRVVLKVAKQTNSNRNIIRLREESKFDFNHIGLPKTIHFEETIQGAHYIRSYQVGITVDEHWKKLRKRERLPFLISLLKSLIPIFNELEKQKVVHCDIKPSNILIEEINSGIQAHLIDFGLAIKTSEIEDRKLVFPLGFAAPELILNQLDIIDQTADIYALGITIWRLYTGKLPLTHANPSVFTNLQLTHPIQDHPELPTSLFKVISKMCYKHSFRIPPNKLDNQEVEIALICAQNIRYQNLNEVMEALTKIQKKRWW